MATDGSVLAWRVDSISRANLAVFDGTNTLARAKHLGRHFQGVIGCELPRAEALGYGV